MRCLLALGVGIAAYVLSSLISPPHLQPELFGIEWQQKSADPWLLGGQFPHRLLAPVVAHYLGLGGANWVVFTQLTSVLLLCLVFHVARWRGAAVIDAALATLGIAVTGAIQIYKFSQVGYVDNFGYALILLTWMAARHTLLFWGLILANLTNHEMVGFLLPWFWFLRREVRASVGADVVGAVVVLVLYKAFRAYVAAHASGWDYDGDYFLDHAFLPYAFVWLWALSFVYQLTMFGPILAIVMWHSLRQRPQRERVHTLLIVGGYLAIFMVAYDVNRHANLIFIPLLLASTRFLGHARSRIVFGGLIAATALISSPLIWRDAFHRLYTLMVVELGGGAVIQPEHRFELGRLLAVSATTVARVWPFLLELAGVALASLALAIWCQRRGYGRALPGDAVIPATPAAAGGVFRRATAALVRRRRSRGPTTGT